MAIFDASRPCCFENREIIFDTNVYLFIDGVDRRAASKIYSGYYWNVIKGGKNKVIINDYIISEFFNRCCKDQHALESQDEATPLGYKARRKSEDFIVFMESVRDSCIHFIGDAEFRAACEKGTNIEAILTESAKGALDFSDVILSSLCSAKGLVLVTDDYDYIDCDIDIVTANHRLLTDAKSRGILAKGT